MFSVQKETTCSWEIMFPPLQLVAARRLRSEDKQCHNQLQRKKFNRSEHLSASDTMEGNCFLFSWTINDVLLGVASAALSRYYFRKLGGVCVRLAVVVSMRPTPGIQKLDNLMDPRTHNDAKWGNRIGYIILPFNIISHEDPLEYVRQAKKSADRKRYSLKAIFTQKLAEMATKMFGAKVSGALFNRMVSSTTAASSNVTRPVEQLELFGNKVVYIARTIYGHPSALTIHWQSYMDIIRVVLAVDDEQFPDSHQLLDDFVEAPNNFQILVSF